MKIYEIQVTLGGLFEGNSKKEVLETMSVDQLVMINIKTKLIANLSKKNLGSNVIDFNSYKERKKL